MDMLLFSQTKLLLKMKIIHLRDFFPSIENPLHRTLTLQKVH